MFFYIIPEDFFFNENRLNSFFSSYWISLYLNFFWSVFSVYYALSSGLLWGTENDIKSKGLGNIL